MSLALLFVLDIQAMFKKPILLGNKRRLRIVGILLGSGAALAFAPLLLGIVMMTIEEILTGKNVGEHNSVWGVLPWLTIGTMAIFGGPTLIFFKVVLVGLFHDKVVIALGRTKANDGREEGDVGDDVTNDGFVESDAEDASRPWDEYDLKL